MRSKDKTPLATYKRRRKTPIRRVGSCSHSSKEQTSVQSQIRVVDNCKREELSAVSQPKAIRPLLRLGTVPSPDEARSRVYIE